LAKPPCQNIGHGHSICRISSAVQRPGGVLVSGRRIQPFDIEEFSVLPEELNDLGGWAEIDSNCNLVETGSWRIDTQPTSGVVATAVSNGPLSDGSCPGISFPFAEIYYTWTNPSQSNPQDQFDATWSVSDGSVSTRFVLDLGTIATNSVDMHDGVAKDTIVSDPTDKGKVELDFSGANNGKHVESDVTSAKIYYPGNASVKFDRTKLTPAIYTDLVTKWLASMPAVKSDYKPATPWNVLGVVRYSQYNTPAESGCTGGSSEIFVVKISEKAGKTSCTFTVATMIESFLTQTDTNGTGSSIGYGLVKPGGITRMNSCPKPWPAGATTDNSYVQVSSVTGKCNTPLIAGTSVATLPLDCGEALLLVDSTNVNYGNKAGADRCPLCSKSHIDSYSSTQSCGGHDNVDLGNFWTLRTN
jgi:hypothetical protein